eukprot:9500319-Pyramimonas_sp.AAC.1
MNGVGVGGEVERVLAAREVDRDIIPVLWEGPPWQVWQWAHLNWVWRRPTGPCRPVDGAPGHLVAFFAQ